MDYHVKIGDIFYKNTDGLLSFFQVVGLKAKKQVIIKEIESEIDPKSSTDGGQTYNVFPKKDQWMTDSDYTPNEETLTKTLFVKKEDSYFKGTIYFSLQHKDYPHWRSDYFLWDKRQLKNDYWIWFA